MKRIFFVVGFVVLLGGVGTYIWFTQSKSEPAIPTDALSVTENPNALTFEIVDTPAAREQGLSGRAYIPSGYGMLFVFDAPTRPGFWMKDMLVAIDIIWLRDDGTIIGIEANVSPDTYPQAFMPPEPVRLVLETRAGEAQARGWVPGTRIELPLID